MKTVRLNIGGMMCDACKGHVTRALLGVAGVANAQVKLEEGTAIVELDHEDVSAEALIEAVVEEGYTASVL